MLSSSTRRASLRRSTLSPSSAPTPLISSQGHSWNRLLRRLASLYQGSVSTGTPPVASRELTPFTRLNLRTTINVYRQLGQFVEAADAEARARGEVEDTSIDAHFRSGVYLGVGMSNVILSLMPSKVLTIIELFGYKGDRHAGLDYLMKPGGWSNDRAEPAVSVGTSALLFVADL